MAVVDFNAYATTMAGYFKALTPPTGEAAVRNAFTEPQSAVGVMPMVDLRMDEVEWITGNGLRSGRQDWTARFVYAETNNNLRRTEIALRKWMAVLSYTLLNHVQIGGAVNMDSARIMHQSIGTFTYDKDYIGIEILIHTTTSEPWPAVS